MVKDAAGRQPKLFRSATANVQHWRGRFHRCEAPAWKPSRKINYFRACSRADAKNARIDRLIGEYCTNEQMQTITQRSEFRKALVILFRMGLIEEY
jgi:hypothetical protein